MVAFKKGKRAKDGRDAYQSLMQPPADPKPNSKTVTPEFSVNLERQITVTDQIIKKKLEKAKKLESERKTIGIRRDITKEKLKEIRVKQVQEMMKIKKKFVEEF